MAILPINEDIIDAAKAMATIEPTRSLISYMCIDISPINEILSMRDDYDILRNSIVKTAYNEGDGYNSSVRNPRDGGTVTDSEPAPRRNTEGTSTRHEPETSNPVAISKAVIATAIKAIPGTRQHLIQNVTEDDYRTVSHKPRATNRNVEGAGFDRPSRRESLDRRPRTADFRDSREVSSLIRKLDLEASDAELDRDYELAKDIDNEIYELKLILKEFQDEEDYGRGSRDRGRSRDDDRGARGRDRDRDRDDSRGGRDRDNGRGGRGPLRPRAVTDNVRDRERSRPDRFGRDR